MTGLGKIYAGRVVSGIGIGAISAVAPAFVSECSPKEVRGRITGCFQIMVSTRATGATIVETSLGANLTCASHKGRVRRDDILLCELYVRDFVSSSVTFPSLSLLELPLIFLATVFGNSLILDPFELSSSQLAWASTSRRV